MDKNFSAAIAKQEELENKNPQIALDAILPSGLKIGGIAVSPLTLAHYVILEKIKSPLVEKDSVDWEKVSNVDLMKMCYVVTHKPAETRELLVAGQDEFEKEVFEFCSEIHLSKLSEVGQTLGRLMAEAMAPIVSASEKKRKIPDSAG